MDLEQTVHKHFQVPLEVRSQVIENKILKYFPADYEEGKLEDAGKGNIKTSLCKQVESVIDMYAGQDANVLTILSYASQQGRLTQYLTLLEGQYSRGTIGYLLPELRPYAEASNMKKSQEFFIQCYADLGVEARDGVEIMQSTKGEQVRGVCDVYKSKLNVGVGDSVEA